jgi:hypothetical protein
MTEARTLQTSDGHNVTRRPFAGMPRQPIRHRRSDAMAVRVVSPEEGRPLCQAPRYWVLDTIRFRFKDGKDLRRRV